ncbi:MAG: hypothetical protein R6V35_05030 [Candidatus Nanohaloarchaea archaeon]
MTRNLYHGRGEEGLRNIAETGFIQGSTIEEEEVFTQMSPEMNVYGKEKAIWVTDSRECAEIYAWGGGYLELDPTNVKVIEDPDSCYGVIMRDKLPIDHFNRIMVEEQEGARGEPQKNLDIEIADLLDEKYNDIRIGSYESKDFTVE